MFGSPGAWGVAAQLPTSTPCLLPLSRRFMPSFEVALKELTRVLKPGGLFAAAVWQSEDKAPFFLVTKELAAGERGNRQGV